MVSDGEQLESTIYETARRCSTSDNIAKEIESFLNYKVLHDGENMQLHKYFMKWGFFFNMEIVIHLG